MKTKYNVTRVFLYSLVIPAFLSVCLFGSLWISTEYERFKKEAQTLQEVYFDTQKNLIKEETDKVIDYIEYKKSQAEERLKQTIKGRTNEAYDIALNLYNQLQAYKSPTEIQQIIIDALRPVRYNNQRGYYFITRLDGVEILFADRPEMEGLNLIDLQDSQGKFVIRDMIDIVRNSGEGFYRYTWTKPKSIGEDFPKIAYIRHFEPFDWLIGTGGYLDDVVQDIQQEVLARIENITFGDDGYIFAGQWDGLSLINPAKGKNMINVTDANGVKIVQELIKAAKSGGGFVSYVMPKFNSDVTYNKLSYATGIPEWKWYVGAGVNVDNIETILQHKKLSLQKSIRSNLFRIIMILSAIVFFIFITAKLVTDRISRSFNQFSSFFSKAATESATIDSENLHFKEFETLAHAANRMIRERNKAEKALRDSERKYRELVQSVNSIILRLDTEGNIIFINKYAQSFFGYSEEEILGRNAVGTIVPQVDRSGFDLAVMIKDLGIHPEQFTSNENENIRRNGERVRIAWMNKGIYDAENRVKEILCVGIDVTEKWQLEKRLAQAQKMEAIGTLAGGIAHDFNNILSAILGYTELSLLELSQDSSVRNNLKQVLKASGRARDLVQQILTYSRQREREMQPLKISLIINEALKLLRASLPSTIEIRHSIKSELAVVSDPTNIHQVIMNLCTNAGYAMQEDGGLLQVNLIDVELGADFAKQHPDLTPGKFVCLTVSDTGIGMAPETMERIFDPFFSTKKKGEGTGMGLSVVHGIVKSHGGAITVDSSPGRGAVFTLYFPAIESESSPRYESANLMLTGTEHILFVDDEPFQTDIAKRMLTRLGYHLTTCTSSIEALEIFRQTPEVFDLVITDMTMPRMPGDVLAKKLIAIRPDIPVIVCTGYSERINSDVAEKIGVRELVMKPVVIKDLAAIIRRVLDECSKESASSAGRDSRLN